MAVLRRPAKGAKANRLFPNWRQLLVSAVDELRKQNECKRANLVEALIADDPPDFYTAADKAKERLGPSWPLFLKKQLDPDRGLVLEQSLDLAKAIWQIPCRLIITTNHDRVLEWACPNPGDLDSWHIGHPAELAALLAQERQKPTVWHLHGRIDNAAELVLTPAGYHKLYLSNEIEPKYTAALFSLRQLLTQYSFLFIGFSFEDKHLYDQLEWLQTAFQGYGGPHFAFVHKARSQNLEDRLRTVNITCLPFEAHGDCLIGAINALANPAISLTGTNRKSGSVAPFMVPSDLSQFTSRDSEILELKAAVEAAAPGAYVIIVGVTGQGGVGKSALVIRFAHMYREEFPDGIFWVRVDSEDPMHVAHKFAQKLDIDIPPIKTNTQAQQAITDLLRDKRALVVLDNADGEQAMKWVEFMRPDSSSVSVIVTTRNQALCAGLGATAVSLQSFTSKQGLSLFERVLGSDKRMSVEREVAELIVKRLGGLPLAVDIAVQYLAFNKSISFSKYNRELVIESLELPNKSVRATVNKSMMLLSSAERCAFVSLGSCAESGFSVETAAEVAKWTKMSRLGMLLDKLRVLSLIQPHVNTRFTLHPVIRACVRAKRNIKYSDLRHAERWAKFVQSHAADSRDDWCFLTDEWDGIRSAWDYSLSRSRKHSIVGSRQSSERRKCQRWAAEIAVSVRYYMDGLGYWNEALMRMPESLEAALSGGSDPALIFSLRRHLSLILRKSNRLEEAERVNETNLRFAKDSGRSDWYAKELEQRGRIRTRQERYVEAERDYRSALRTARSLGLEGRRSTAQAMNCLGVLLCRKGEFGQAIEMFEEVIHIYESLRDGQGLCATYSHLARAYGDTSQYETSASYYATALELFELSGRFEVAGSLHQNFGYTLERLGNRIAALACYVIADDVCGRLGIKGWRKDTPREGIDRLVCDNTLPEIRTLTDSATSKNELLRISGTIVKDTINTIARRVTIDPTLKTAWSPRSTDG